MLSGEQRFPPAHFNEVVMPSDHLSHLAIRLGFPQILHDSLQFIYTKFHSLPCQIMSMLTNIVMNPPL